MGAPKARVHRIGNCMDQSHIFNANYGLLEQVDEFDANQIGGHAAAQQIRADRLQPVPGYLTRIYHEDINK